MLILLVCFVSLVLFNTKLFHTSDYIQWLYTVIIYTELVSEQQWAGLSRSKGQLPSLDFLLEAAPLLERFSPAPLSQSWLKAIVKIVE